MRDQLTLLRMRNLCPAFGFDASFTCAQDGSALHMIWEKNGMRARLDADLATLAFTAQAETPDGTLTFAQQ